MGIDKKKFQKVLYIDLLITQLLTIAGFFTLGILFIKENGWVFILIAVLLFGAIPTAVSIHNNCVERTINISSTIIALIFAISLSVVGGIHLNKRINADSNYELLRYKMMHCDYVDRVYEIESLVKELPITYKDSKTIKEEVEDVSYIINRYEGRDEFGKINNFDYYHDNWDFTMYYYNFSIKTLLFNAMWQIDDSNSYFRYCRENGGEWIHYNSSLLPNDEDPYKDYYFYTEYGYYNNKKYKVNQYIIFGFENKDDKSDKFLAYKIGNYGFDKNGKRVLDIYCYSDDSTHLLTYYSEI